MTLPRVLILGAPGAGKGSQSSNLADAFGVEHITTGDALRANPDMKTEFGTPREYMGAGELVPDPVVNEIVEAALERAEGFVLDGYPRNVAQAKYLEGITDLDAVIYLDVGREELVTRLIGRRVCSTCGATYHLEYDPPAKPGTCDECGGELVQRDDDTEATVRERLRVFEEETRPVVEWYRDRGELDRIDGERPPAAVWDDVRATVEAAISG